MADWGMADWALWIEMSAMGRAARGVIWLYPAANVLHVLGAGLLFGAIAAFDIAVLRHGPAAVAGVAGSGSRPGGGIAASTLPLALAGAGLALLSGAVLFAADAVALAGNGMLWAKTVALVLAAGNALAWHMRPPGSRRQAAASLALWIAVLTTGRLIAYV
ncbi:MAG: hypothetical protein RLY86_4234 [Pseudomonadota bacterium]|jgi:hypothetical protein